MSSYYEEIQRPRDYRPETQTGYHSCDKTSGIGALVSCFVLQHPVDYYRELHRKEEDERRCHINFPGNSPQAFYYDVYECSHTDRYIESEAARAQGHGFIPETEASGFGLVAYEW